MRAMIHCSLADLARAPICLAASLCVLVPAVSAQDLNERRPDVGETAETGAGLVGQRQEADQNLVNVDPRGRLENRIENRVRNRIDNRIDHRPDTAPDLKSYEIAGARARQTSRLRAKKKGN